MDEDEEVIFEGDPLYNHLLETGHLEFEYMPKKIITNNQYLNSERNNHEKISFKGLFQKSSKIFRNLLSQEKLVEDNITLVSLKLLQNGILPEDLMVLENFSSLREIHLFKNSQENEILMADLISKYRTSWPSNIKVLFLYLGIIFLLLTPFGYLSNEYLHLYSCLFLIFFSILSIRLVGRWKFNKSQCNIDSFVALSHDLFRVCSRSQKILNEIDFITKDSDLKFLTSTHTALYTAQEIAVDDFNSFLTKCHYLLKSLCSDLRLDAMYVLFDQRFSNVTKFIKVLDDTPLTRLKVKREALGQQYSAFVTEFLLLMEASNCTSNTLSFRGLSIFDECHLSKLKCNIVLLEKCILLANQTWFVNDELRPTQAVNKTTKLPNAMRVANSLSSHCKTLLANFYRFEELLEHMSDVSTKEGKDLTAEVESFCDQMTADLQSCSGCIDEIKTIFSSTNDRVDQQRSSMVEPNRVEVPQNPTITNEDPIIIDEVFEAYVSACQAVDCDRDNWTDDREDRRSMLKQKTHCKSVLKEMQPILRKRRTMWEKREEIALKRTTAGETVVPEENNKPDIISRNDLSTESQCIEAEMEAVDIYTPLQIDQNHCSGESGVSTAKECRVEPTEETFVADGDSDGIVLPNGTTSLNERIASWSGNVGLGLMSVLTGSSHVCPPCSEEVFNAIGEQESESDCDMDESPSLTVNVTDDLTVAES